MKVRSPEFDFTGVSPHWAKDIEMAQFLNATNIIPMYIEPFLISVLRRAKPLLDPIEDAQLLEDIDTFNRQEAQHYKKHGAFMAVLRESYGPEVKQYEEAFSASYDRMLSTMSLRALLAYCQGFEERASASAAQWVDGGLEAFMQPIDARPMELYSWHLAEEYEHRHVVDAVARRIYGKPSILFWAYRVYYFFFSAAHMELHRNKVFTHFLAKDREQMTDSEVEESRQRETKVRALTATRPTAQLRKSWRLLSPFYHPESVPPPKHLDEVLARY